MKETPTPRLEDRDTRRQSARLISGKRFSVPAALFKTPLCLLAAWLAVYALSLTPYAEGLDEAGLWMLRILVFAAGLWITEALPAFVVAILVIALEIAIFGRPGGVYAEAGDRKAWQLFVQPWSASIMWLFMGGFVLAQAAVKTGLDRMCAQRVVHLFGSRPHRLLAGVMAVTFAFSMFMSNTATTAMMIAVMAPVIRGLPKSDRFGAGLLLGVALAANIGGMGTMIGTPPNAIAVGAIETAIGSGSQGEESRLSFFDWMVFGLPVALILAAVAYAYLLHFYRSEASEVDLSGVGRESSLGQGLDEVPPKHHQWITMGVFTLSVLAWMTGQFHGMPSSVVSFFALTLLALTGVINAEDMRKLPWDVLLLLAGGLALGEGIKLTGVAAWLPTLMPEGLSPLWLVVGISYLGMVMSNVMSNTATAAMLMPVALAVGAGSGVGAVLITVPLAMACSSAMCLPISTPPNAIAFASGLLRTSDFLRAGLLFGLLGPLVTLGVLHVLRLVGV